jgi:hypothetical protein
MKITQVRLISEETGNILTCWVPSEQYKIKEGMRLSLDREAEIWKVVGVYWTQEHFDLNRRWDVGGL